LSEKKWPYTEQLSEFSAAYKYENLPSSAITTAKDIILDTLGALFAAWPDRHPVSRLIGDHVKEMGGAPECTVLGRDFKVPAPNAALANGTMGYAADIEGGGIARMHAAAAFVPTILVMGERQGLSGKDILTALALAYDISGRVSEANRTEHSYPHSFHPSAVFTTFGTAAIAGYALQLDAGRFVNAYGLAGNVASGLIAWVDDPSEHSRSYGIGVSARNGVTAGLLAEKGFGGPQGIFDPMKYNIYDAFSGAMHLEELTKGLGVEYRIEQQDGFKLYPCCGDIHTGLDALLKIIQENQLQPEDIAQITHQVKETRRPIIDNNPLHSHNAQYIMAIAAVDRQIRWNDFLHDRLEEPSIATIFAKTRLVGNSELESSPSAAPAIVDVHTQDGRTFSERVDFRKGHSQNPFTPEELCQKYKDLATPAVGVVRAKEIMDMIQHLEEVENVRILVDKMTKGC
jgi:2-methylcitrate dehydratase PrpD